MEVKWDTARSQSEGGVLAVIRLRGIVGRRKEIEDTMRMLGLKRKHVLALLPRTDSILGMIQKTESFVTWGELDSGLKEKFSGRKIVHLKPPRKGLKSLKRRYPKGDLGYRGKEINELIKRML